MIAVVGTIGNDYMVLEMQAHDLTCFLYACCQIVIGLTRMERAGWVIVADCDNRSITEHGFLCDNPNVY